MPSRKFSEFFQETSRKVLSLEFFPPKKEENLPSTKEMIRSLASYKPDFMTCTYGAGGSTRGLTQEIVRFIGRELDIPAVAHLTCVGHSSEEIDQIVQGLLSDGVSNILALRGDPPKGESSFSAHPEGFSCARDLVHHLSRNSELSLAVAGYPETHVEAVSPGADIEYLREKVDAGAELILTQLFFEADVYFSFLEKLEKAGISVPVSPGIMPIAGVKQVRKFTEMCGASIPEALASRLVELEDKPDDVRQFGIEYAVQLSEKLMEGGAPGIHLYTLNKSAQAEPVIKALSRFFVRG